MKFGAKVWTRLGTAVFWMAASVVFASLRPEAKTSDILADGIRIWRKPGAIMHGAACATCHSPDGIEIAAYNFDDADIRRRASEHLDARDTDTLLGYIHALRSKLGLYPLRDPLQDRPLQPGGSVLPGETAEARDLAFGRELKECMPSFFSGPIDTTAKAKSAEQEMLRIQPVSLRIGIPLNRLSEDVAHGKDHASIAQWLPEVSPAIPEKELAGWYAAEDLYLCDPSQEHLAELLRRHSAMISTSRLPDLDALSVIKFRALLVWQDRIRHRVESAPYDVSPDVAQQTEFNAIWEVGEFSRELIDRDPTALGMSGDVRAKKLSGPPLSEQEHQIRSSWFWAGWLSDQGLFRTSREDKTRLGQWMATSLSQDGPYAIHNVFASARRQAVISNDVEAWGGEPMSRRRRIWDFAGLRSFGFQTRDLPTNPEHRRLYIAFTANCFRMNMLLLGDDIHRTGIVWRKQNARFAIEEMTRFIEVEEPQNAPADEKRRIGLLAQVDGAKERR